MRPARKRIITKEQFKIAVDKSIKHWTRDMINPLMARKFPKHLHTSKKCSLCSLIKSKLGYIRCSACPLNYDFQNCDDYSSPYSKYCEQYSIVEDELRKLRYATEKMVEKLITSKTKAKKYIHK